MTIYSLEESLRRANLQAKQISQKRLEQERQLLLQGGEEALKRRKAK